MIIKNSIPIWPKNVSLEKECISDLDLRINYPINSTSYILLKEINGKRTIEEIAETVSSRYNWETKTVKMDFCTLIKELNQQYLINIYYKNPLKNNALSMLIYILLLTKTIDPKTWGVSKRFPIDTRKCKAFFQITRIIVTSNFWMLFYVFLLLSFFLLFIDSFEWLTLFTIVPSIIFGMVIHEFAHYIVFVYFDKGKHNTFLVTKTGQIMIIRPPMNYLEDIFITMAGPILPFLLSVIFLFIISILEWANINVAFAWWAALLCLAIHIIFLLPPFQDGKRIISLLLLQKGGLKNNDKA